MFCPVRTEALIGSCSIHVRAISAALYVCIVFVVCLYCVCSVFVVCLLCLLCVCLPTVLFPMPVLSVECLPLCFPPHLHNVTLRLSTSFRSHSFPLIVLCFCFRASCAMLKQPGTSMDIDQLLSHVTMATRPDGGN